MRRLALKRKITGTSELISLMSRNLDKEIGIVRFYEDNLHLFNDGKSRKRIKELALASLEHAAMFVEAIHRLQNDVKPKKVQAASMLAKKNAIFTLESAMKEEKGAEDLYLYEAKRITDKKTAALLRKIAGEEINHQKIVKEIAAGIAKWLPDSEGKRILKKTGLI
jgi:rubrerythrin